MQPDEVDLAPLFDMLRFARGVRDSLAGATFESFVKDENLRLATERRIEIIGEAARQVSEKTGTGSPHISWDKIIGRRRVLAHEYGSIRYDLRWRVVTTHFPELITHIEALLPDPPSTD